MAVFGRRRRKKQQDKMQKEMERAHAREIERQQQVRRDEMQREIFQTTEGQGVMEGANISLGFEEEDELEELRRQKSTRIQSIITDYHHQMQQSAGSKRTTDTRIAQESRKKAKLENLEPMEIHVELPSGQKA